MEARRSSPSDGRVLVTGANGFVGAAVMEALLRKTARAARGAVRRHTQAPSDPPSTSPTQVGDICSTTDWSGALADVQSVIHTAARVHVMRDTAVAPLSAFRLVNVDGTLQLARQAVTARVRRFIFLSSIKVNGEKTAPAHSFAANDPPHPQDPYAISKHEAEVGLHQIAADTGMQIVIIRLPLVYGPGVHANFAALLRAVARGVPLPLGALHNLRSLIALDNLVDFIITCLEHPAAANETFVVCDGEDLSTPELVRRIAAAMNRPARLLPVPAAMLKAGAALVGKRAAAERLCGNLQIDNRKACELLGWRPPISVDEGLRRAVVGMAAAAR